MSRHLPGRIERRKRVRRVFVGAVLCSLTLLAAGPAPIASASAAPGAVTQQSSRWQWPIAPPVSVTGAFVEPADAYSAGHRGIDVAAVTGTVVLSPADGEVAFVGVVVDRPLITIDHGGGYVSTLEPVTSSLTVGDAVVQGDAVGTVGTGGHTPNGSVHWGVRLNAKYISPATLLGNRSRPVLLPCCETLD